MLERMVDHPGFCPFPFLSHFHPELDLRDTDELRMWGQHLPLQLPISNSNSLALFGRHSICVSHLGNLPIFSFFFVVVLPRRNKPKQFTFLFLNVFWWRWRWASLFTENPFDVKNSDVGSISYGEFASTWCKAQKQLPVPVSSLYWDLMSYWLVNLKVQLYICSIKDLK